MKQEAALKLQALTGLLLLISVSARWPLSDSHIPARLPSGRDYLLQQCEGLWQTYEPLIASALAPYKADTLSIDNILHLQGRTLRPQVFVINNTVRTFEEPANNTRLGLVPLLAKLSTLVSLPNLVLVSNNQDEPESDVVRRGGPWFGYCNHLMITSNIMYPASTPVKKRLSCGDGCMAFGLQDTRQDKAVFLGSSTGWPYGRRRAVVLAGIDSDKIHSGYTQLVDISQETLDSSDPAIHQIRPALSMLQQVRMYKYIINADGNCAAHRLRHLLASDSVVFWIESNQVEWFYSLLQPFVHYVPIRYDAHDPTVTAQDILLKLQWAEDNPSRMAAVVDNANEFAQLHLTEHGLTCYSVQLFNEYSSLFSDSSRLGVLANEGKFDKARTHFHTESLVRQIFEG